LRLLGQRARDDHALLLAARELVYAPVGQAFHLGAAHGLPGNLTVLLALARPQRQVGRAAHEHNLADGEGVGQVDHLRHHRHAPRALGGCQPQQVHPVQPGLAAAGRQHAAEHADERRLARAVGANQGHHLAVRHVEAHAAQHGALAIAGG
jgi:hypothetical protein